MSAPSETALAKKAARNIHRAEIVDRNFIDLVSGWQGVAGRMDSGVELVEGGPTGDELMAAFRCQVMSRHMDFVAREMRARNEGFYTIGSSGHEGNAALGLLSRTTDPAFLHYRSGGFMMARLSQDPDADPLYSTALSLAASAEDPASGGRHKVWGSRAHWVLPQTSTIASHLPKALGTALGLEQARRLGREPPVPGDAVVICSFGDASANHAAALTAFNSAQWATWQNLPVPLLFVCEDNGLGISVKTPGGWIEASFLGREGLRYFHADGCDLRNTWAVAREALDYCREERMPAFLHLDVCRLLGHAGTDVETDYLSLEEVEANEARDPLLASARTALEAGLTTPAELLDEYEGIRQAARAAAERAATRPRLERADEVMAPLVLDLNDGEVMAEAARVPPPEARAEGFDGASRLPEAGPPRHLSLQINAALRDLMVKYPEMTIFGEDVARKGGVYTVTSGLARRFRGSRVFNTLLDETTIMGLAQGAGYMGLLPFPEIQYLAYFHNACDQVRGEAASLQFFSDGQFANPMVIRVAGLGYQKGFGGHFHNDNATTALRDIPGVVVACPSRGDDAAMMLRTCAALARVRGRVVFFLEPIALYMRKDLHEPKDGQWTFAYPEPSLAVPLGEPRIYHPEAKDLLVITYGNGVPMSLVAARRLAEEDGVATRVMDLRWLKPLSVDAIAAQARGFSRVLVVDEGRRTGGISEEIFTALDEHGGAGIPRARVVGEDSYIPLGAAAETVLPSAGDVVAAARELVARTG